MSRWGTFDFSEFENLAKQLNIAVDNKVVEGFISDFMLEMAYRALRKTKMRTNARSHLLRNSWRVGNVVKTGDTFTVELHNPVYYASYVENGHRTGKGLTKWVPGQFMATISIQEIERELPIYLENKVEELLNSILGDGR